MNHTLVGGEVLTNVHHPILCTGRACAIHNPSIHALSDATQHWRSDRGIIERICSHGCGHPDPDQQDYFESIGQGEWWDIHGCDGCCTGTSFA